MTRREPAVEPAVQTQLLLLQAYLAYNAQDGARLLMLVSDDVDWPDDDGGRLHGRRALSDYWTEQWRRVRVHDHPVAFAELDDGRVAVQVEQVVRALDGSELSRSELTHLHRVAGGRLARLDAQPGLDPVRGAQRGSRATPSTARTRPGPFS